MPCALVEDRLSVLIAINRLKLEFATAILFFRCANKHIR
jgi:hypothetical protein